MSKRKQQPQRKRKQSRKQPKLERRVSQTAFTEIEEAFFAAGSALCAEHASAHIEAAATPPEPRGGWWRRLLARVRADAHTSLAST